jgi:hypothetical protein
MFQAERRRTAYREGKPEGIPMEEIFKKEGCVSYDSSAEVVAGCVGFTLTGRVFIVQHIRAW